jgi:hypothetical protein
MHADQVQKLEREIKVLERELQKIQNEKEAKDLVILL